MLGADGRLISGESPLSVDQCIDAYRWMTLSRLADERAFKLQRQGRMGTFSPTRGQEASVVGSQMALDPATDWIVPQYRELGALLRHGLPLEQWFRYWMGHMQGGWVPRNVKVLPPQIALAAQIPHGVGIAWGLKIQSLPGVVLTYFGDGASSEGDFHEGANFAGVMRAPVILFLQNNGWAISTPRSKQTAATTFASRAIGYGIEGRLVDGNDLLAVYAVTSEAVARARAGGGATLIESVTYRLGPHNTADDHLRYVDPADAEARSSADPMVRLRAYLGTVGAWDADVESAITDEATRLIADAVDTAERDVLTPSQAMDHVYATLPPRLARQREEAMRLPQEPE